MRFLFRPPAAEATDLLSLPWDQPLETWTDRRMIEIRQRGISRHVVRFVAEGGRVYALKEISERLARREYHLLGELQTLGLPAVSVLGICVERPDDQERSWSPATSSTPSRTGTCSPACGWRTRPTV